MSTSNCKVPKEMTWYHKWYFSKISGRTGLPTIFFVVLGCCMVIDVMLTSSYYSSWMLQSEKQLEKPWMLQHNLLPWESKNNFQKAYREIEYLLLDWCCVVRTWTKHFLNSLYCSLLLRSTRANFQGIMTLGWDSHGSIKPCRMRKDPAH